MNLSLITSPVVCTIYGNGSYTSGCTGRLPSSGGGFDFVDLILAIAPAVMLGGILMMTKYYEYPYGRWLWKFNGILGVGVSKAMSAAVLGKMYRFTEKYLIFVPMGSKKNQGFLVTAVPESVHQIEQKAGGLSMAMVDLDTRVTVEPDMAEWSEKVLSELSDTRDWPTFLLKWKYAQIVDSVKQVTRYFPEVADWNPGTQIILLPKVLPSPNAPLNNETKWIQKPAKDATDEEKLWYIGTSQSEAKRIAQIEGDIQGEKNMLMAAIMNQKTYIGASGKETALEQRDKFALSRKINDEFANAKGQVKDAVIGGKTIPAQRIAEVMRGVPNPEYIDALRENIHEQEAKKKKANTEDMMKFVIVAGVLVVIMVVAVIALNKFG